MSIFGTFKFIQSEIINGISENMEGEIKATLKINNICWRHVWWDNGSWNVISIVMHLAICWWEGKVSRMFGGYVNVSKDRKAASLGECLRKYVNKFNFDQNFSTSNRILETMVSVPAQLRLPLPETASSELWIPCQHIWDWLYQKPNTRDYIFRASSPETSSTRNSILGIMASVPDRQRLLSSESESESSWLWLLCQLIWDCLHQKPHPRDYGFRVSSPESASSRNRILGTMVSEPAHLRLHLPESASSGIYFLRQFTGDCLH